MNNRGINSGGDFHSDYMEKLYDNITNNEFIIDHDAPTTTVPFTNASKKGWLTKQGGRIKTWKRRLVGAERRRRGKKKRR